MAKKFIKSNNHIKERTSLNPDLHDTAWIVVQSIQSSASAKQLLAKDLMLLLNGIRASVLVDYLSPKSISKDLLSVIRRGKTTRKEFDPLQLAQLCDSNFLLIHLRNLSFRLSQSIDSNLTDYLFIDCSASLSRPILLSPDSTDSLLLPAFRAVLQHLLAGSGDNEVLNLRGEESGAPLPTLGGWLLEYPVVYYVACPPGPHHRTPTHRAPQARSSIALPRTRRCGSARVGLPWGRSPASDNYPQPPLPPRVGRQLPLQPLPPPLPARPLRAHAGPARRGAGRSAPWPRG